MVCHRRSQLFWCARKILMETNSDKRLIETKLDKRLMETKSDKPQMLGDLSPGALDFQKVDSWTTN